MIKYFVLCLVLQTCLFEGRAFFDSEHTCFSHSEIQNIFSSLW